jgi:outer membrane receptor protein involved in Fe transport
MHLRGAQLLLAAALLHVASAPLPAAERMAPGRHTITGTVNDAAGHPVARVAIRVETPDGRVVARAESDAAGHFVTAPVSPGTYTLVARKKGLQVTTAEAVVGGAAETTVALTLEAEQPENIVVIAKRLERARNDVYTTVGGSVYHFTQQNIQDLPQGQNTPLNQVLLQAPGVAQDSFGQVHVRGDHGNLQFRVNGIALPQGVSGFTQTLTPRFANSIDFLTGALPAEYGFRTAGVVDIQTKTGLTNPGGSLDLYGGQRATFTPTLELGGTSGGLSYYGTGSYFRSDRFIEPPTNEPTPVNGQTNQGRYFTYLSYILNPNTRVVFMSGAAIAAFGLPAARGVMPSFTLEGVSHFPSIDVRDSQLEENYYNVLALQGTAFDGKLDYQTAAFSRYSRLAFYPDQPGELIFNGVASNLVRSSFANGMQTDAGYKLNDTNTLRFGYIFQGNRADVQNNSLVFPADSSGMQTSHVPFRVIDNSHVIEWLYGGYVQDEWRPLEPLTVNAGVRLDRVTAFTKKHQVSPRLALSYKLTEDTVVHAAYARYFTPPAPELVQSTDIAKFKNTTNSVAGSNVNTVTVPDTTNYYDIGANHQLLPGLTLGADAYYRTDDNLIDEGQFGKALVISPFNYQSGQIYGVEATASYTREAFSGYANFAYSKALGHKVTSAQFNFAPDELAFIGTHYVHLDHDQTYTSSVGAAYRYRGFLFTATIIAASGLRSGFANTDHLPYYVQADLGIEKAIPVPYFGEVRLRGAVVNVADMVYQIRNGTGIGVFNSQFGPRRAFYAGINIPLPFLAAPQPATAKP